LIFVTVGSDVPFDRLVEGVDSWSRNHATEEVFAQIGSVGALGYVPTAMTWIEMLESSEFERRCAEARLIIAHAGMGSIISALTLGTPLVVMPRHARLGETRSDHQLATAKRFASQPGVFVATTQADLAAVIDHALITARQANPARLQKFAAAEFTDRLRESILGVRGPLE
jgi:UDP-N-acetylglucosamine transferase subunit ALG13